MSKTSQGNSTVSQLPAANTPPAETKKKSLEEINREEIANLLRKGVRSRISLADLSSVSKSANKPTLNPVNLPAGMMVKTVSVRVAEMFCNSPYGNVWGYLPPESMSGNLGEDGRIYLAGVEVIDGRVYYRGDVIIYAEKASDDVLRTHKEQSFKKTLERYVGERADGVSRRRRFQPDSAERAIDTETRRGPVKIDLTTKEILGDQMEDDDGNS